MAPFGDYKDFEDCVNKNGDKDDPEAYCGTIKRQVEGKSLGGFFRSAFKALEDILTLGGKEPAPPPPEPRPAPAANPMFFLTKEANGRLRWTGTVSGNFKDRDKEVFPAEVHQEFIEYLDKGGRMPELWVWHTPGSRFGQADFADVEAGFVLMSGLVDEGKEFIAEKVASLPNQGMSHGFRFRYREPGVIGFYRTHEVSVLPQEHCSFPWAKIEIQKKEWSMKPEKRAYLESVLGKEAAEKLITDAETLHKNLVAQGVDWKDFDPEPPAPAPAPQNVAVIGFKDAAEYEAIKALAALPAQVATILKVQEEAVKAYARVDEALKALTAENATLKAETEAIKAQVGKSQDDLISAAFNRARGAGAAPASKSKENIVPAGDPLAGAKPFCPVDKGLAASLGAVLGGQGQPAPQR